MKIIVFSDSHGYTYNLKKAVEKHLDANLLIHLGDGQKDIETVMAEHPNIKYYHVAGNCDFGSVLPSAKTIDADYNIKIFATHGHLYHVKYTLEYLKETARESGCNIVLYGHTHIKYNSYEDGLYILNPGSISCPKDSTKPSYAIIDISKAGIVTNIIEL